MRARQVELVCTNPKLETCFLEKSRSLERLLDKAVTVGAIHQNEPICTQADWSAMIREELTVAADTATIEHGHS